MKKERAIYAEQRRREQQREAEELMKQHWIINDPGKTKTLHCKINWKQTRHKS